MDDLLQQPINQNDFLRDTPLDSPYLDPNYLADQGFSFFQDFSNFFIENRVELSSAFDTLLFILAVFFLTVTFYSGIRVLEIRKKEHMHLEEEIKEYAHHQTEQEKKKEEQQAISENSRWITTLKYLFSENAADWKLAVIEADAMLEDLMAQLGFQGDTLGEKLKGANQSKFSGLTKAWEVHNIRNRIAHEGGGFDLSHREAKRVIAIYESIFREFGYI